MKIFTTHPEEDLSTLARRLFKIGGVHADAEERRAVTALRLANPHLRARATLAEGTPVVVPDVEGLDRAPSVAEPFDLSKQSMRDLQAALERVHDTFKAAQAAEDLEAKSEVDTLKRYSREIKATAPEATELLAAIQEAAKNRTKELNARRGLHEKAFVRLRTDLKVLIKAVG